MLRSYSIDGCLECNCYLRSIPGCRNSKPCTQTQYKISQLSEINEPETWVLNDYKARGNSLGKIKPPVCNQ